MRVRLGQKQVGDDQISRALFLRREGRLGSDGCRQVLSNHFEHDPKQGPNGFRVIDDQNPLHVASVATVSSFHLSI